MSDCEHDKRFSGVFFLPKEYHGCVACGFEALTAEIEQKNNGIEQLIRYIEKSPVLLETVIIERLRSIQSFQTKDRG